MDNRNVFFYYTSHATKQEGCLSIRAPNKGSVSSNTGIQQRDDVIIQANNKGGCTSHVVQNEKYFGADRPLKWAVLSFRSKKSNWNQLKSWNFRPGGLQYNSNHKFKNKAVSFNKGDQHGRVSFNSINQQGKCLLINRYNMGAGCTSRVV